MYKTAVYLTALLGVFASCTHQSKEPTETVVSETIENPTNAVLLSSDIVWEKLNPARGDESPQAGTIWGDRHAEVPTGFLAKFVDGFSSPPHIHNATYRAVVIKGNIHNNDPAAANMWMKPGSFWTQPKGESHITSAKGEENIALVEIDKGPYLVHGIEEAFDNGERPINIDASNVVWLNGEKTNWIAENSQAEISFLWDANGSKGLFVKLPEGYDSTIKTDGTELHAVVIQGDLNYTLPQNKETKILDAGSTFSATSKAVHAVSTPSNDVVLYIRTNGNIKID
ncbi:DUF4437 domain-containing protein [Owenweeksia hongkongensis]|uniref:DUF4437 domain-containing protein n=1 Tax=Owenweeksia hongkongensis TaxID=253245 RepID=UPI003A90B672